MPACPQRGNKGSSHPNWKGGDIIKQCLYCGKDFICKRYRIKAKKAGKFCSKACNYSYHALHPCNPKTGLKEEIVCVICNKHIMVEPARARVQKTCSVRCSGLLGHKKVKTKDTSIELAIKGMLDELNVQYIRGKQIEKMTVPDFIVDKILIYADGDYWHSRPEVVARDNRINYELPIKGYKLLRLKEYDIKNTPDIIKEKLKEEILQCLLKV